METRPHLKMLPAFVLLVALAALALLLTLSTGAGAATIVVPDDYGTIQEAIDNAVAGDTIRVNSGSFSESIQVHTRVAIVGNGTGQTLIVSSTPDAVELNADGCSIIGVQVQGGGTSGIVVRGSDCVVEDVLVTGTSRGLRTNDAQRLYVGNSSFVDNSDYGMIIHLSNNVTVYGCNVSGNLYEDGIQVNAGLSNITISHTLIDNNGFYGIEFLGDTDVRVDQCTVTNNQDNGIYVDSSERVSISDCNISWNWLFGTYVIFSGDVHLTGNLVSYNLFGLYIDNSDGGEIAGNRVISNDGAGISLFDAGGTTPFWVHGNWVEGNAQSFDGLEAGIFVGGFSNADGNIVEDNDIIGNYNGLVMRYSGSKDTIVRRNLIKGNDFGLQNANGPGGNLFYHNNFVGNNVTVRAPSDLDRYDSGYPNGGNYWDAYNGADMYGGPAQDVYGPDGLMDVPFALTATILDHYPLARMYGDNPLASIAIVHPTDGDMVEGTVIAEAVVTGDIVSLVEWYLDDVLVGSDSTEPYQLILDTTKLLDVTYDLNATAYMRLSVPITDSISITPNNVVREGPPFNVTTVSSTYNPDDQVTVVVSSPGNMIYDWAEIEALYVDDANTRVNLPTMEVMSLYVYGFTFRLPSDVAVGNVTLYITVKVYWRTSVLWTSMNNTRFAVEGTSQGQQLADLLDQLNGMLADIDGLNATNRAERTAALADILDGLDGLDSGITARMDGLEASIGDNTTALQEYIGLQSQQVQMYMDALNVSMAERLDAIEQTLADFRLQAGLDLTGIATYLEEMDANGSARHGEVLAALEGTQAMLEDLNTTTLEDLRARLVELDDALEGMDDAEAARHKNTVDTMLLELDDLSGQVSDGFNVTDSQMGALSKLDDILERLDLLSDDVAEVQDNAGVGVSAWNMLLILAFGIITVLLMAFILIRVRDLSNSQPPHPIEPEPVREPAEVPVTEEVPLDTSFGMMMKEPEMYRPYVPEPSVEMPEEPPEVPPEIPPPQSFPEPESTPTDTGAVEEVPPPEPEVMEEIPSDLVPIPAPDVPPLEPVEVAPDGFELEPLPEPELEEVPAPVVEEEVIEPVLEEIPEEPPVEEPEAEVPPVEEEPEEGDYEDEEPEEGDYEDEEPEDEEPEEKPRRPKTAQEWVIDEILEEL